MDSSTITKIAPPGRYRLGVGIRSAKKGLDWLRDILIFEVEEVKVTTPWFNGPDVFFRLPSQWEDTREI